MNDKRIFYGVCSWFMAIVVPLTYHVGLALSVDPPSHTFMPSYFFLQLPWPVWLYMALTGGVGCVLVIAGLFASDRGAD